MLVTVNPQQPPASSRPVLTQALFTQAHNKSTTFLGRQIRTHRGGDNGDGFTLGLFRFSSVARLDNTSQCTKGATTRRSSQGSAPVAKYFGSGFERGGRRQTQSVLNNPLSRLLSLITNCSEKTSPGNILSTADRKLGTIPVTSPNPVPHPSTYYLETRLGSNLCHVHRKDEAIPQKLKKKKERWGRFSLGRQAAKGDTWSDQTSVSSWQPLQPGRR